MTLDFIYYFDIIKKIKEGYPDNAITISLGERSYESYKKMFEAGADRYLLRHETASKKLYEELLMAEEGLQDTQNKLIHIGKPIEFDKDNFEDKLEVLKETAYKEDAMAVRRLVKEFVPTYKPDHVSDNDIQ